MKRASYAALLSLLLAAGTALSKPAVIAVIMDTSPQLKAFKVHARVAEFVNKFGQGAEDLLGVWRIGTGENESVAAMAPMAGTDRSSTARTVEASGSRKGQKRTDGDLDASVGVAPAYLVPLKQVKPDAMLALVLVAGGPLSLSDASLAGELATNGIAVHVIALGDADPSPLGPLAAAAGGMIYRAAKPDEVAGALDRVLANLERARIGQPPVADAVAPAAVPVVPTAPVAVVPTAPVPTAPVPTAPVPTAPVPTAPVPTAPVPTAPVPTPATPAVVPTAPVPVSPTPTAPVPAVAPIAVAPVPAVPPSAPAEGATKKPPVEKPEPEEPDSEASEAEVAAEMARMKAEAEAKRVEREAKKAAEEAQAAAVAAAEAATTPWWIWAASGGGGLICIVLLVMFFRRKKGGDDDEDAAPASGRFDANSYFDQGAAADDDEAPPPPRRGEAPSRDARSDGRGGGAPLRESPPRDSAPAAARPRTSPGGPTIARFTALGPGPERFEFSSDRDVLTIGRKSSNDVVIVHQGVSGGHAEMRWVGGQLTVIDKNSTNGTFVNNRRVRDCALNAGDIVRFDAIGYRVAGETVVVSPGGRGGPPADEGGVEKTRMFQRGDLRSGDYE
ncbi:MAG: FHA domain-containing protein [Myxococcales bacterium]|nr:FHA domain-containing protein [Myxococcales bacterium]